MAGTSLPPGSRRRLPACGLALALAAAACGAPEPPPFLVISGPKDLLSLEVRDHEGALWRIEAAEPVTLEVLDYGVVPPGFRQTLPADGSPPRAFRYGEPLSTRLLTAKRLFRHQGYAEGPASWSIEWHEVRVIGKTISAEEAAAGGMGGAPARTPPPAAGPP